LSELTVAEAWCQVMPAAPVEELSRRAYQGYDCCAGGRRLTTGAVLRGWARGRVGFPVPEADR
jgi:hypothetical protein